MPDLTRIGLMNFIYALGYSGDKIKNCFGRSLVNQFFGVFNEIVKYLNNFFLIITTEFIEKSLEKKIYEN